MSSSITGLDEGTGYSVFYDNSKISISYINANYDVYISGNIDFSDGWIDGGTINKVTLTEENEKTKEDKITIFNLLEQGKIAEGYSWKGFRSDSSSLSDIWQSNKWIGLAAAGYNNYSGVYINEKINFDKIEKVVLNFSTESDMNDLTNTVMFGFQEKITEDLAFDQNKVCSYTNSNIELHSMTIDTSDVKGEKYLKYIIHHGLESSEMTVASRLIDISLYY